MQTKFLAQLPSEIYEAIADTAIVVRIGDMGIEVPAGHIAFNASRPLPGHQGGEGDFLHGIHYSFIDPSQPDALKLIGRAKDLDGWVAICGTQEELDPLALAFIQGRSPEYAAMFERIKAKSPERANNILKETLAQFKGKLLKEVVKKAIACTAAA